MKTSIKAIAVLAAGILSAANGFAAPLAGFTLAANTEHFSFYSHAGSKVPAEKAEQQLQKVATMLGEHDLSHNDYYHYDTVAQVAATTGSFAGGVTYSNLSQVHSTESARDHEIVHLVAGKMGNPGAFFQEGLAVTIGDKGKYQGESVDAVAKRLATGASIARLITRFDAADPKMGYAVAGSFVKWLVKTQGLAKVSDFFRACPKPADATASFSKVFGQTLDQAGTVWAAQL
jgi:hypothetical protein